MKAIVLAAGRGTRLGNKTEQLPKALLDISGRPLLEYTLDFLAGAEWEEIIIVGGFEFETFAQYLKKRPDITLLQNKDFHSGNIVTLKTARQHLNDGFLLMNADHIYPKTFLSQLLQHRSGVVAACDFDRDLVADDMKVWEEPKGQIKSIHKKLAAFNGGYIGMTLVNQDSLANYLQAFDLVCTQRPEASVEEVLQQLADQGTPPRIADLSGSRWYEIDTPQDLKVAEDAHDSLQGS